jgi:poly-beta-1,6-N-acetyl-D-glucosamine synthase
MEYANNFLFLGVLYATLYTASKILFSLLSLIEIKRYFNKYDHVIDEDELKAHYARNNKEMPLITIVCPAYNEETVIIDSVKSFLNQSYQRKEVIICSDGSTDGTVDRLIETFELVEVENDSPVNQNLTHKPIKRYLRSTNPDYSALLVLDKVNGGKADALNASIAASRGEIITTIDADSILERNALIHLDEIFEREPDVVAIGTPIGVVNDCDVGPDGVEDASVPKSFWAKIQVIEYLRSFLLGRMFAQRYHGVQIVSGALGVYKKWMLEALNGFTLGSLAEDFDIDVKILKYIMINKLDLRIRYIPEAFCWTEVPSDLKTLSSQRDRWARGMTQVIWSHKDVFFNFKLRIVGMFSFPYFVIFEWMTPFIEMLGLILLFVGITLGYFPFTTILTILLIYWAVGFTLNIIAISVEAVTKGHYKNRMTLVKLSMYALIEPIFYHWINSYLYVMGNIRLMIYKKTIWGEMTRVGIVKQGGIIDKVKAKVKLKKLPVHSEKEVVKVS